jgi:hypothetical protein
MALIFPSNHHLLLTCERERRWVTGVRRECDRTCACSNMRSGTCISHEQRRAVRKSLS